LAYPLYVAFVWHMHQPYYKDFTSGEYILPWARLHGAKEYIHMAEVLAQYPEVKATFNFVPSLVEQLLEYAQGDAVDRALALSRQETWSDDDKAYLLSFFFSVNWERVIRRYPRYNQLLELRHRARGDHRLLSQEFYRDLVAWFNLVWLDHIALENDPELRALVEKGRGFTRDEIDLILRKQEDYLACVVPLYSHLRDRGQIELTTSPYYHPILPLLIDSATAQRASPGLPLPANTFRHFEDAVEQVRRGVEAHKAHFGQSPRGLWPSEGAVCPEILPILARHGIRWFATDEATLARSLGVEIERDPYSHVNNPRVLYQPYTVALNPQSPAPAPPHRAARGANVPNLQPLAAIFRDHTLSDRIGFVYQGMPGRDAAEDMLHRLHVIRQRLDDPDHPYLVSIILDGENCWESYPDYGDPFLHHLYRRLTEEENIQTVTVSEYLEQFPPREAIHHLATGSWINGNLETWIGEAEQNRAWEVLGRVRDELVAWQNAIAGAGLDILETAWRQIYIAEGSDWFWWYYSRNVSGQDHLFDRAFREHLAGVYFAIGRPLPPWLTEPIQGLIAHRDGYRLTSGYIAPHLVGGDEASLEWTGAGFLEPGASTGAMQRAEAGVLRRLYFGYSPTCLYFRVEARSAIGPYDVSLFLRVEAEGAEQLVLPALAGEFPPTPFGANWRVDLVPGSGVALKRVGEGGSWQPVDLPRGDLPPGEVESAAGERAWEVCLPLSAFGLRLGGTVGVAVVLARDDHIVESIPSNTSHIFTLTERG
jgi:alpha-amylase/alpha-mannosidase (GH57 family)